MRIVILGVRRCVRVACSGWKGVTRVVHSKPPEGKTNHDTEKQTPTNYRKLRLYLYIRIVLYLYIRIVYIYICILNTLARIHGFYRNARAYIQPVQQPVYPYRCE